jgi:hypothetical protein
MHAKGEGWESNIGMNLKEVECELHNKTLIMGWCILLRLYYNENDHNYLCSQLIVSLLYTDHTKCFGYTAIFRCVIIIIFSIFIYRLSIYIYKNVSVRLSITSNLRK